MIVSDSDFALYLRDETQEASVLAQARAAAEGQVKAWCQRSFETAATVATARVFTPANESVLRVYDFMDTASLVVSNNGTAIAATDYQLEPLNGLGNGFRAVPYQQIRLTSGSIWYMYNGKATVTITAKWGWTAGTVPDEVIEAVLLLGKDWVQQRSTRLGYIETSAGVGGTGGRNWAVLNALAAWRRVEAFGVG